LENVGFCSKISILTTEIQPPFFLTTRKGDQIKVLDRYGPPVTNGARHAPAVVTTYHHLDAAAEALYANKHILPSGKLSHNYGKSPFLMGKSTTTGHFQ
jgi:hypothetical protein